MPTLQIFCANPVRELVMKLLAAVEVRLRNALRSPKSAAPINVRPDKPQIGADFFRFSSSRARPQVAASFFFDADKKKKPPSLAASTDPATLELSAT